MFSLAKVTTGLFRTGFCLIFFSPYIFWLLRLAPSDQVIEFSGVGFLQILPIILAQAGSSALLSIMGGLLFFLGLQHFEKPGVRYGILLFPILIPPLFVALAWVSVVQALNVSPFGFWAVVVVHALMNSGLVAYALDQSARKYLSGQVESAWILSAKRWRIFGRVLLPGLFSELLSLYVLVFVFSLSSFSIPLLLAAGQRLSIETVTYDLIRLEGRWWLATVIGLLQALFVVIGFLLLQKNREKPRLSGSPRALRAFRSAWISKTIYLPFVFLLLGWVLGLSLELSRWPEFSPILVSAILSSLALGLMVGLLVGLCSWIATRLMPSQLLSGGLLACVAPSPVLIGFATILWPVAGENMNLLKAAMALTLIQFPALYRWQLHNLHQKLLQQIFVARSLGAKAALIHSDIVWPQLSSAIFRMMGLSGLWAVGDFAVVGFICSPQTTVSLMIEDYTNRYHWAEASGLLLVLMFLGGLLFSLFSWSGRYVADEWA